MVFNCISSPAVRYVYQYIKNLCSIIDWIIEFQPTMFFLSRINIFIAIIAIIMSCGLLYFVYYSLIRLFKIRKIIIKRIIICFLFFLTFSFLLPQHNSLLPGISSLFGAWMAVFPLLILSIAMLWFIRWVYYVGKFRFSFLPVTCFFFITPFLFIGYGIWQSTSIKITEVSIPVKNLPTYWKDKSIVHITDLHLSDINQRDFLEIAVGKIHDISPELVVITGDFIDGRNDDIQDLLSPFRKLSSPILFTTGNHDWYFPLNQDLNALGIDQFTVLNNELNIALSYANDY